MSNESHWEDDLTMDNATSNAPPPQSSAIADAKLTVLALMFATIMLGNTIVITSLLIRRKKLTRMYFFILHLCIADLIVAFLHVLPQLCWDVTHRFQGNDFLCKVIKFGQLLGPYLSSYILVGMAIDRYLAICFPLNSWAATRSKGMVCVAWVVSVVFSSPQMFLFSYKYVSVLKYWECWVDFTLEEERAYVTWYFVANTFVPLLVLVYTYSAICWAVWRNFRHKKNSPKGDFDSAASSSPTTATHLSVPQNVNHIQRNGSCRFKASESVNPRSHGLQRISRAKIKTVKLTVVVITCYILCSMPYTCAMMWVAYDKRAQETAFYKGGLFPVLVLVASLNSCVNPWVYLLFNKNLVHTLRHYLCCSKENEMKSHRTLATTYSRTSFSESVGPRVALQSLPPSSNNFLRVNDNKLNVRVAAVSDSALYSCEKRHSSPNLNVKSAASTLVLCSQQHHHDTQNHLKDGVTMETQCA
uniref:G-protein coupled receptors family 1 profile domain-containing protein n=1 Tax=Strigamia maritima TaxID=126957 RepID=T1JNT7_STRMM